MTKRPISWYLVRTAGLALLFALRPKAAAVSPASAPALEPPAKEAPAAPAPVLPIVLAADPPSDLIEARALQRDRGSLGRFDRSAESLLMARMWR